MTSRRNFIALLGGTAVWPLAARAQQPAVPVIGLLTSRGAADAPQLLNAVRQGLRDTGFIEGQSLAIEYRFAGNENDRLPALAADLVRRQVAVITAFSTTQTVLAAKSATTTIPIVFQIGSDPVAVGLVASLNRPGSNITGVTNLSVEVAPKRLELVRELLPSASNVAVLLNPANITAETQLRELQAAARTLGLPQLHVLHARDVSDFKSVFESLVRLWAEALVISSDAVFAAAIDNSRAGLALRDRVLDPSMGFAKASPS